MDRLTADDQLVLWSDDTWPQDIGALMFLDGSNLLDADGQLRIHAVQEALKRRLHILPRLRQVLYFPRCGLGRPLHPPASRHGRWNGQRDCPGGVTGHHPEAGTEHPCPSGLRRGGRPRLPSWSTTCRTSATTSLRCWLRSHIPCGRSAALSARGPPSKGCSPPSPDRAPA